MVIFMLLEWRSEAFILYGSFAFIVFVAFGGLVTYLMCK